MTNKNLIFKYLQYINLFLSIIYAQAVIFKIKNIILIIVL